MADPYIAQIIAVGFNFQIRDYALCNGQLLPISSNQALFALVGTIYGGDGRTTLGLPELRGRTPIHYGARPGGSNYNIGQAGGTETVTLTPAQLPPHTHSAQVSGNLTVSNANGTVVPASDTYLGAQAGPSKFYTTNTGSGTTGVKGLENASVTVGNTGSGQAVDTLSPYLAINFQISLLGLFPTRN